MGNVSGKEDEGGEDTPSGRSNGARGSRDPTRRHNRAPSADSMSNTPPGSPSRSPSPFLFTPQVPVAPLQRGDAPAASNQLGWNQSHGIVDNPPEKGIPTIITWNFGGNDVAVEGSWDNWTSRKRLQRSGKDHSILLVLASGIYHYRLIVDGEMKYIPDLPFVADEAGHICNILDVHKYVPENVDSIAQFEGPPSPDSTYSQEFPMPEYFTKEPASVPSQLHLTVLGVDEAEAASCLKPQHVVLNHLFIERGLASQSVVALGLSHRYKSKYITVVLYKPMKR